MMKEYIAIGVLGIGLRFGLVLLSPVYCLGDIYSIHVNPTLSIAIWLDGRMKATAFYFLQ